MCESVAVFEKHFHSTFPVFDFSDRPRKRQESSRLSGRRGDRCEEGTGFNSYGIGKKLVCFVSLLDKVKRCATVWSWPRSTPCSLTEKGPGGRRRDVSGPGGVGASLWTPSAPARAACPESVPVVRADPRPGPRPAAGRRLQGTMGHRCVCQ